MFVPHPLAAAIINERHRDLLATAERHRLIATARSHPHRDLDTTDSTKSPEGQSRWTTLSMLCLIKSLHRSDGSASRSAA